MLFYSCDKLILKLFFCAVGLIELIKSVTFVEVACLRPRPPFLCPLPLAASNISAPNASLSKLLTCTTVGVHHPLAVLVLGCLELRRLLRTICIGSRIIIRSAKLRWTTWSFGTPL
jgi:hypothetical protein